MGLRVMGPTFLLTIVPALRKERERERERMKGGKGKEDECEDMEEA